MRNWLAVFNRRNVDRDLREELESHMQMRAAEYEQQGLSASEAAAAAHKQFGSTVNVYEDTRRVHIGLAWETLGQELRYALRTLRRTPSFTAGAVLALALGIGASTAVFSVVDRILFRGLPYPNGDRLVAVGVRAPLADHEFLLGGDYSEWKEERSAFSGFTSTRGAADCDITDGQPVRLSCGRVEWTFLPALGIEPVAGRNFTRDEDQPGAARTAILSHALWKERYGGDPQIEGRRIQLDGQSATVVGVLPANFEFPTLARVDLLIPQQLNEPVERKRQSVSMVTAFGLLKPGVSIPQAKTVLDPHYRNFLNTVTPVFRKEISLHVVSLNDLLKQHARTAAWALLGAVVCVVLIAWANVANLLLARAASRTQESSIRAALGAGRGRLMAHHAAEMALLGAAGWVGGMLIAGGLLAVFRHAAPQGIIGLRHASLDARILLFSALVLAASTLAFMLFPLADYHRPPLHGVRVAGGRRMRLRGALVTAQLAISVVLVTCAGLLIHTLWELASVRLGVRTENRVTASAVLGTHRYRNAADRYAFIERLEKGLERLPGVSAAAIADALPPLSTNAGFMYSSIAVDGQRVPGNRPGGVVQQRHVTPAYFRALGIPLLRGRAFTPREEGAAILSDRLARRLFPKQDPVGHKIQPAGWRQGYTVIGVAANVKNAGLTAEDAPELYLPFDSRDGTSRFVSAVVESSANAKLIARLMRGEIRSIDPTLPVKLETFNERIRTLNERPRFNTLLLAFFAAIAVGLAATGVYGVLAFLVSQRVREIGLRMAVGADRARVLGWILSYALRWAAAGILLGAAGALLATRQIRSLLYRVSPLDPWTFAGVVIVLAVVAVCAAYVPARRAAAVDPAVALRME